MSILGFDTSNYTTSVAYMGETPLSLGKLLEVPQGALGLRQQEALFQHLKALPTLLETLLSELGSQSALQGLSAIGVATRPRAVEGSYMPCFLAGENMGKALALSHGIPCIPLSHQQGHLAAALWSLQQEAMMTQPFLAWHLSGGTTELLLVRPAPPEQGLLKAEKIGGTTDISAGQLLDRTGLLLGATFPAGKTLDTWASSHNNRDHSFPLKTQTLSFSLSGMENKVQAMKDTHSKEEIASFLFTTLGKVLGKLGEQAQRDYQITAPILFSGGVASSAVLRSMLPQGLFPEPKYATDNAMGIAVLAEKILQH